MVEVGAEVRRVHGASPDVSALRACPGPGYQEPDAQTLSWVWDEGSSDDDDDDAVLEGVGLVFCKSQCDYSDPPSLDGLCDDSFAP